jgi:hypothetical protein
MLAGARQAIRSQRSTLLLGIAVVALLAIAAVGSGASVPDGAPVTNAGTLGAAHRAGGTMVAAFAALLVVSTALAGVILRALMPSRRSKKAPDDVEWVVQRPAISRLEQAMTIALLVLLLAAAIGAVALIAKSTQHGAQTAAVGPGNTPVAAAPASGAASLTATRAMGEVGGPWLQLGLTAGAALVGAVALTFFALQRVRKRKSGQGGLGLSLRRRKATTEAVTLSLEDLRRERDPRRAIVAAYARMERVFARAGLPRSPHETPTEFLRRVLSDASAPPAAVSDLTQLFQEAKFSRHELTSEQRDDALRSLLQIRDVMTP